MTDSPTRSSRGTGRPRPARPRAAGRSSCCGTRRPRPRPRAPTEDQPGEVVDAGVAIADAEGLDALSMRKVAGRLGIGAMSLYTYVPGRSELIELMIDRVYAEHRPAGSGARLAGPSSRSWMRATWRIYYEPIPGCWTTTWPGCRSDRTCWTSRRRSTRPCHAAGLHRGAERASSNLIRWQLLGAARSMISDAAEERHTGVSAEAYWESRASFWTTYFDYDAFPDHGGHLGGRRLRRPGRLRLRPA